MSWTEQEKKDYSEGCKLAGNPDLVAPPAHILGYVETNEKKHEKTEKFIEDLKNRRDSKLKDWTDGEIRKLREDKVDFSNLSEESMKILGSPKVDGILTALRGVDLKKIEISKNNRKILITY